MAGGGETKEAGELGGWDETVGSCRVGPVLGLVFKGGDFLKEVGGGFAVGAEEAASGEEREGEDAWAVEDDVAVAEENEVVEELEGFGGRLEERYEHRGLAELYDLLHAFNDLECC